MNVSLIVPFRPDGAERDRNWKFLKARYEALYPGWELVEGRCEDGPWSKGRAVNAAVEASSGDVLVISDADVMVGEQALRDAVGRLQDSPWVVPHRLVYRLTEEATRAVIEDRLCMVDRPTQEEQMAGSPRKGPPGGGISVMRRQDFVGVDERFLDWGGEDISFGWALDTLVGPHRSLGEAMWHLYHEPMHGDERRGSSDSEALAGRYREASGNPVAMGTLLAQRPYEGWKGGGIVVAPRKTVQEVPLDPRFRDWGQEDESWEIGLRCLAGPCERGEADLVHLWHEPVPAHTPQRMSQARGSQENWDLRLRYLNAQYDPDEMEGLVKEARVALDAHQ